LIQKDEVKESKLTNEQKEMLTPVFQSVMPENAQFHVTFENMSETDAPALITQNEWMRRMKDMSAMGGGGMSFYGEMPDSYNLVINSNHAFTTKILSETEAKAGDEVKKINAEISVLETEKTNLTESQKSRKPEEITQSEKDMATDLDKQIDSLETKRNKLLTEYGKNNDLVKQLTDLALLANNMLKGEALNKFVKRSIELIK
jgi:molecular chaperone HtpG